MMMMMMMMMMMIPTPPLSFLSFSSSFLLSLAPPLASTDTSAHTPTSWSMARDILLYPIGIIILVPAVDVDEYRASIRPKLRRLLEQARLCFLSLCNTQDA